MEAIVFEQGWQSFFASHQLHRFEDFFNHPLGRTINQNSKRNVIVLELDDDGRKRVFYMKRFVRPHFKDMLSAFCHFGTLCSQAEVEWRNANILLKHGIETYHPVCYGVCSHFGIERQSFFVTEQISGQCLQEYLTESWTSLEDAKKQDLVIRLGKFFQKIHAARIALPDAYIWHVYMVRLPNASSGDFELGMIDLHRMKVRTCGHRHAAKDLGGFLFSLPDGFMDAALRSLFMDTYLGDGRIRSRDAFCRRVHQWELKISSRRKREIDRIE